MKSIFLILGICLHARLSLASPVENTVLETRSTCPGFAPQWKEVIGGPCSSTFNPEAGCSLNCYDVVRISLALIGQHLTDSWYSFCVLMAKFNFRETVVDRIAKT
jgi:hypothetical protein